MTDRVSDYLAKPKSGMTDWQDYAGWIAWFSVGAPILLLLFSLTIP